MCCIHILWQSTQKLSRNSLIKDVKGKEVPALDVFAHVIRYLKNHLLENVNRYISGFTDINKDIHWVLPVPAIWDNSAKQFMREAANQVFKTHNTCTCIICNNHWRGTFKSHYISNSIMKMKMFTCVQCTLIVSVYKFYYFLTNKLGD